MSEYGPLEASRRTGREHFHDAGQPIGVDLLSFWQWAVSDLVSNATRGSVAEFLVASALGVAAGVRDEWAAFDLTASDGTRIEVKSAAYIQGWHQDAPSRIVFNCKKSHAWSRETNLTDDEYKRQSDVYVFCLLDQLDQEALDVMDVSQWRFFVVPTLELDRRERSQHSITLRSLEELAGGSVAFAGLMIAVGDAAERQRQAAGQ